MLLSRKWRLSEFRTNGIDSPENDRASVDSSFQLVPSWKIHERQAEQNGQEALARKDDHRDSGENQHYSDQIPENIDGDSKYHMVRSDPATRAALIKIIDRHPNEQNGNSNQRSDKEDTGQDTENNESFF